MITSDKEKYWRDRASKYSGFKWVNDEKYLYAFIGASDLKKHHIVLDAGCGPGIVSRKISPLVERVIGMDNSVDMLNQVNRELEVNFMFGDVADNPFPDRTFHRVLARNVFHHMTDNLKDGIGECFRVLKRGGKLIVGERTPPSKDSKVHAEYRDMLLLKENRHTFTDDNLHYFLASAGFKNISFFPVRIRGFNVDEWLRNSGLPEEVRAEIYKRHICGSDEFKGACQMREVNGECVIDLQNIVMAGVKP